MVKLEEINDDGSDATKNAPISTQADLSAAAEDASMDDLYDRAVAKGGFTNKSFEEALSDLSATPLFMKDLNDVKPDHGQLVRLLRYTQMQVMTGNCMHTNIF